MTAVEEHHEVHAAHAPPPTGWRRLLAPGWLRVPWMIALFFGIGSGIAVLVRWAEGWHPIWKGEAITTSSEVVKFAHTSSGMRQKVIPGARIVMIVTRKLSAVMIEDAPAHWTLIWKKTDPSGWCVEQSGA